MTDLISLQPATGQKQAPLLPNETGGDDTAAFAGFEQIYSFGIEIPPEAGAIPDLEFLPDNVEISSDTPIVTEENPAAELETIQEGAPLEASGGDPKNPDAISIPVEPARAKQPENRSWEMLTYASSQPPKTNKAFPEMTAIAPDTQIASHAQIAPENGAQLTTTSVMMEHGTITAAATAPLNTRIALHESKGREKPPPIDFKQQPIAQTPVPTMQAAHAPLAPTMEKTAAIVDPDGLSLTAVETENHLHWETRSAASQNTLATQPRSEIATLVGRQIAEALKTLPDKPVELALNPEELGRVKLSISATDASVTVNVLAERQETLDLMRRHIDQLAREFEALGYSDINFAFAEGQNDTSDKQSEQGGTPDDITNDQVGDPTPSTLALGDTTGVDLRL